MPLRLHIRGTIDMPDHWLGKQDWEEEMHCQLDELRELFSEDPYMFLEDIGKMGIIESAEWVD